MNRAPAPPHLAMTPEEVAQELRLGRTQVFALLKSGALPSFQIGRLRRIRRSDLEAFVEQLIQQEKEQRA